MPTHSNGGNWFLKWATDNQNEIMEVARRWNMTPQQLIISMLDDSLEAYKNVNEELLDAVAH